MISDSPVLSFASSSILFRISEFGFRVSHPAMVGYLAPAPEMDRLFDILHEDPDLLVINKPAGLVCHPTKSDEYSSLIGRVRLHLGPGSRPQLVNRLDRETSGVTIVAKQEAAARDLRRLWEKREIEKEYLAIVQGHLDQAHGFIDAPLGKDIQSHVAIKDCVRSDGAPAQTEYWVQKHFQRLIEAPAPPANSSPDPLAAHRLFSLLRVVPRTGRKHQIRIHLQHTGSPIVGDKLYGEDENLYLAFVERRLSPEDWRRLILPHHALHASAVRFLWHGHDTMFRAEPEPWFRDFVAADQP
jgi:23S rRNA pseudouridine1911/1915/1917 synthase